MLKRIAIVAVAAVLFVACSSNKPARTYHNTKSPYAAMSRADKLKVKKSSVMGTLTNDAPKRVLQMEAIRYEFQDAKTDADTNYSVVALSWLDDSAAGLEVALAEVTPLLMALDQMIYVSQPPRRFESVQSAYTTHSGLSVELVSTNPAPRFSLAFGSNPLTTGLEGLKQFRSLLEQAKLKLEAP